MGTCLQAKTNFRRETQELKQLAALFLRRQSPWYPRTTARNAGARGTTTSSTTTWFAPGISLLTLANLATYGLLNLFPITTSIKLSFSLIALFVDVWIIFGDSNQKLPLYVCACSDKNIMHIVLKKRFCEEVCMYECFPLYLRSLIGDKDISCSVPKLDSANDLQSL